MRFVSRALRAVRDACSLLLMLAIGQFGRFVVEFLPWLQQAARRLGGRNPPP